MTPSFPRNGVSGLAGAVQQDHDALERVRRELASLHRKIDESRDAEGVQVQVLERIIDELRDPRASRMRSALRDAVSDLELTYRSISRRSFKGYQIDLRGDLKISHKGEAYTVPFSTAFESGAVTTIDHSVAALATSMRQGLVPSHRGRGKDRLGLLARELGVTNRRFTIGGCQDSDLLRIGMAALYPYPLPNEDASEVRTLDSLINDPRLQAEFGDVRRLADNVRVALEDGDSKWIIKDGAPFETWAILAGADVSLPLDFGVTEAQGVANLQHQASRKDRGDRYARWDFAAGQRPTISPCEVCGGRLCAPMRIREIEGLLCLECRSDEGGVTWPERFNAYLPSRRLWAAANIIGEELPQPAMESGRPSPLRKTRADLTPAEIQEIATQYIDPSVTVSSILERHSIGVSTLYEVRAVERLPYRYRNVGNRAVAPASRGNPLNLG